MCEKLVRCVKQYYLETNSIQKSKKIYQNILNSE